MHGLSLFFPIHYWIHSNLAFNHLKPLKPQVISQSLMNNSILILNDNVPHQAQLRIVFCFEHSGLLIFLSTQQLLLNLPIDAVSYNCLNDQVPQSSCILPSFIISWKVPLLITNAINIDTTPLIYITSPEESVACKSLSGFPFPSVSKFLFILYSDTTLIFLTFFKLFNLALVKSVISQD